GGPCVAYRSQSRCCCCPFSSISCGSRLRLELPSFPTRRSSDLPARIAGMQKRIDEAAQEAGRDPGDIRRAYNVMGMIMDGVSEGPLNGPVKMWVEELTRFVVELGLDTFIYWPAGDRLRQMERFANEVVPAVREAVDKARAGS